MYTTNGPKVPSSSRSSGHGLSAGSLHRYPGLAACELTGEEWDELIALGIAETIAAMCLMCWGVHVHLPCPLEGEHLVIAAELSNTKSVRGRLLHLVCSESCPASPMQCGYFISEAAWAPMCWNVQLLGQLPSQTDIPGRSVHNAALHSCKKKS